MCSTRIFLRLVVVDDIQVSRVRLLLVVILNVVQLNMLGI